MKDELISKINTEGIVAVILSASVVISMCMGVDKEITMNLIAGLTGFIGGKAVR